MIMAKLDRNTIGKLPKPADGKFDVVHWDDDLPGLGYAFSNQAPEHGSFATGLADDKG